MRLSGRRLAQIYKDAAVCTALGEAVRSMGKLPESVLVSNRGEIANRVFRTAKTLGVRTVAVYTDRDLSSSHILRADERVKLKGKGYMDVDELVKACKERNVESVHPGYGFLSENPAFVKRLEQEGIIFLGPRAETINQFGLKHIAREFATKAGVPVVPGSGIVETVEEAMAEAKQMGYPVMVKAVAGGGGIGMKKVNNEAELQAVLPGIRRLAQMQFGMDGVFIEKFVAAPRHIEVQLFGDGKGGAIHLNERECSAQRRHQKVIEEAPSPFVTSELRKDLTDAAIQLAVAGKYNSAGTVEFLVNGITGDYYFLEMNTRLQVEHPISEEVSGCDIVEMMLKQGSGCAPYGLDLSVLRPLVPTPQGHSIECRLYAEDPAHGFVPCPGLLTQVEFPTRAPPGARLRVDTWVRQGTNVTPYFDPMVAKLIVTAGNRAEAIAATREMLAQTKLGGTKTNVSYCASLLQNPAFVSGNYDTTLLDKMGSFPEQGMTVLKAGIYDTVQDWPGRTRQVMGQDAWRVGIPPSGPMDNLSHRIANKLVGNEENAATLEITSRGPDMKFNQACVISLCGAEFDQATLNGAAFPLWKPVAVETGDVLHVGVAASGQRGYLSMSGGVAVPDYLGSKSTLPLGNLGGFQGRPLRKADNIPLLPPPSAAAIEAVLNNKVPDSFLASLAKAQARKDGKTVWEIGVMTGPQEAPEYLTKEDMEMFFNTDWEVHYESNRLGVRFLGPRPKWARTCGGDGGSNPSNVVDDMYALMTINISGDMPIAITVDGPSLGGFVCNATMVKSECWKIGQVSPGDKVRFKRYTYQQAAKEQLIQEQLVAGVGACPNAITAVLPALPISDKANQLGSLLWERAAMPENHLPRVRVRRQGDRYVMVEYGNQTLDFNNRFRVYQLEEYLASLGEKGILETSPGVSSLQIDFDNRWLSIDGLLELLVEAEQKLPPVDNIVIPSRVLHLPIALNDRWTNQALQNYQRTVRSEAPYLPSNFEFVARNNGLEGGVLELERIITSASYMALGLGDVYLGCPAAAPVDPRHRLITPKFNPARTFTPEGAVGIGGAFMCLYPLASPGGYQLVGRSLPIWNMFTWNKAYEAGKPWLLRMFDQVRFYKVSDDELEEELEAFRHGIWDIKIQQEQFSAQKYNAMMADPKIIQETKAFRARQAKASAIEARAEQEYRAKMMAKEAAGHVHVPHIQGVDLDKYEHDYNKYEVIHAEFTCTIWKTKATEGQQVQEGAAVMVLEAMKMEHVVEAATKGKVLHVLAEEGDYVTKGQPLFVIEKN
eukprot:gb/GEZN01000627.1/.p1 GENE.gb/GEZN01000627.1/~~gb/GEZN01000627.1/.p1  ORF type:complete len:1280 (+),score=245.54 gb/GEZN01000627.1/:59-3898(+)